MVNFSNQLAITMYMCVCVCVCVCACPNGLFQLQGAVLCPFYTVLAHQGGSSDFLAAAKQRRATLFLEREIVCKLST